MGNSNSKTTQRLNKFYLADFDNNDYITMEEFETIYVKKTGLRPSWKDWKKFLKCDLNNDYCITKEEFLKYFSEYCN